MQTTATKTGVRKNMVMRQMSNGAHTSHTLEFKQTGQEGAMPGDGMEGERGVLGKEQSKRSYSVRTLPRNKDHSCVCLQDGLWVW